MPQRKDTPAARAALARRRQRAAQTLRNPAVPANGVPDPAAMETNGRVVTATGTATSKAKATSAATSTSKAMSTSTANPPIQIKSQSARREISSFDEMGKDTRTFPAKMRFTDHPSNATTTTATNAIVPKERKEVLKKEYASETRETPKQQSSMMGASSTTSQSFGNRLSATTSEKDQNHEQDQPFKYDVRTETVSSTPSLLGEYNIETVLQDPTSTTVDQLFSLTSTASSHSESLQNQTIQPEEEHRSVVEPQEQKQFERISNFGYVQRTSPQPMVPDRRRPSLEMSTPSLTFSLVDQDTDHDKDLIPRTATNSGSVEMKSRNDKIVAPKDQDRQQEDLNLSLSPLSTPQKFSHRKDTTKAKQTSRNKVVPNTKSATRYAGSRAGRSPTRDSRIPSPTTINPDAGRLLPRRSPSPKRTMSPDKKLSPRRFRMPPTDGHANPQLPPKSQPSLDNNRSRNATKSGTNRIRVKKQIPKPTPASLESNRRIVNTHSKPSTPSNPIYQARKKTPVANTTQDHSTHREVNRGKAQNKRFVEPSPNHAHRVEDLSDYLMDSLSIADTSLVLDSEQPQRRQSQDPVMNSREHNQTNVVRSLPHASPKYEQVHNERTKAQFVIQQRVPSHHDEIEQFRASADENDAKHWNAGPGSTVHSTPKKSRGLRGSENIQNEISKFGRDSQAVDAACLHSGNFIMLRSCCLNATLQRQKKGIIAEFDGPCLGKDEELLRVVKIGGSNFSPLMYGDVVVLQSLTKQTNISLCARRKRNDMNGRDEIGFFDDGEEESSRWMIHSAAPGTNVVVGRAALSGKHTMHDIDSPIRSGNSILLVNCYNGGLLSIRDGVAVLLTDSYDPNRMPLSDNPSLLGRSERHDRLQPAMPETFQLLKLSIPPCPTWITPNGMGERLFLTGSYLSEPLRNQKENIIVNSNLPLKAKENILVDEVIGSFLGLEGLYIKLKETKDNSTMDNVCTFQLFDGDGITFDLSLRNLVEQILPLSTSYVCVRNFIGLHYPGYEYGRVMQAFCEGLDYFLQQFVSFVAQLEHKIRKPPPTGALTMKNIHFEITPLLHSMSILEKTTKTVCNKKGGSLINALRTLEKTVYMGDTVAKDLLGTLLDRASVPYAEMLSIWLQSGRLHDPYEEFMIKKTHHAKNEVELDGDTWTELFIFNDEHVINDIVRNEKYKNKILVTGKYWNAVQSCIVGIMSSQEETPRPLESMKLQFQSDLSGISAYIDSMYQSASHKLMHILRHEFHLKESLQIMKRYFLLDQGDFLVNFLEATGEELAKPSEKVSLGRVQHFLGISVQYTESQREDQFNPRSDFCASNRRKLSPTSLRCRLSEQSLVSYLESLYGVIEGRGQTPSRQKYGSQKQGTAGFDFFEIDFSHVPFPISLIISPTSMESYKLLFRHLFFAKHVERRLVGVWSDHQVLKKLDSLRGLLGPTFLLRQRMQHCIQNLINYMAFEVVESNWIEMLSSIDFADDAMLNEEQQTVDDLLNIHDGFLQKTMDACLLTNPVLVKSLIKLLNTCLLFTDQMKRFMDTTRIYDDQFNIAAEKRGAVQRNLNERATSQSNSRDKKKIRRSLLLVKEERDILLQRQTRRVGREICSESYKRMISRFEEVFSADLSVFMKQLNSHTSSGIVANLGIRLDWNGFVSRTR